MKPHFIQVGKGRLALFHRPGGKAFASLQEQGCTHVVTLIRASEHAEPIGQTVQAKGMTWVWVPIPNGDYPRGEVHERLANAIPHLSALLDQGACVLIHCSAGIHRTGMLGYGLLRWRGLSQEEALEKIGQTRPVTRDGMLPRHIRWGNEQAREIPIQEETSWIDSIRKFVRPWLTKIFK